MYVDNVSDFGSVTTEHGLVSSFHTSQGADISVIHVDAVVAIGLEVEDVTTVVALHVVPCFSPWRGHRKAVIGRHLRA